MSSDTENTPTVGEMLRADREAAGLSREQLAQATKIMVNFVEALERDDIAALPGKVFAKGFIKSIYKVIGKDPNPVLQQFDAVNGVESARVVPVTTVEQVRTDIVRKESSSRRVPAKLIIGSLAVGIALVGLIWWMGTSSEDERSSTAAVEQRGDNDWSVAETATLPEENTEMNEVSEDLASSVEAEVDAELEGESISVPEVEDAPKAEVAAVSAPDVAAMQADATTNQGQLLEIVVKQKVKIRMNIDHNGWETNELVPDTYQFRFEEAANLLLFNAAAVEMSYNGKNLGPLGDEGRVRRLSFVAGGPADSHKM